jgi:hypothetical protein
MCDNATGQRFLRQTPKTSVTAVRSLVIGLTPVVNG